MTDDFFRARIDQMIDLGHPLAVLAERLPWAELQAALAPCFARSTPATGEAGTEMELFGVVPEEAWRCRATLAARSLPCA